jgi:hypothetical protein
MEVRWDEKTKTWSMHPFEKKKFSRSRVMVNKYVVAGVFLTLVALWVFMPGPRGAPPVPPSNTLTCPRGYYYAPGSTWAGWERPCIPIGEESTLDGVPAIRLS